MGPVIGQFVDTSDAAPIFAKLSPPPEQQFVELKENTDIRAILPLSPR